MTPNKIIKWVLLATFFISCTKPSPQETANLEVNVYSGIKGLVRLGDTQKGIKPLGKVKKFAPENTVLFGSALEFTNYGVKIYFKKDTVVLIEIQQPFKGRLMGKRLALFGFSPLPGSSWQEVLMKEFGPPTFIGSGGRLLNSNALFYDWGDVAYNNMGPTELAIYQAQDVAQYRKSNFGQILKFFNT